MKKSILISVLVLILIISFSLVSLAAVPDIPVPEGGHVKAVDKVPAEHLRLVCLMYKNNPFWFPIEEGGLAAAKYLSNFNTTVDYIIMGADLKAETVISAMETAIASKYDGIVVAPFNDGTEVVINRAVDAGIPVITMLGESSKPSKRLSFVGTDIPAFAKVQAQATIDYLQGKGKVANITGFFSAAPHELCSNTYKEYLKENAPGIEYLGKWEGQDSADTTYNVATDIITANPDVNIIYCNAGGPYGAAKAIQDLGLTGKVGVVGNDWIPENLKYVKTGEFVICVDQSPFGMCFDAVVTLYNYIVGGVVPPEFIPSATPVLTPATYDKLIGK
jgi:ribose transport system substrate-binding protein